MASRKTGDWAKANRILAALPKELPMAAQQAIVAEGEFLRAKMVEGLTAQAPGGKALRPLSPWTIAARRLAGFRGTKSLIRSGALRAAITVQVVRGQVTVGVPRTAIGPGGERLIDIAALHENGAGPFIVKITPAMRRYLAVVAKHLPGGATRGKGRGGARGYLTIRIPPRPFIAPVWRKYGKPAEMKKRIMARMQKLLAARVGR